MTNSARDNVRRAVDEAIVVLPNGANQKEKMPAGKIRAIDFSAFMEIALPVREPMLEPWLMEQSLSMVHGWRGIGKSHFSFGVAWAVATGGAFLQWRAPRARRVLFVDGELPARVVQDRFVAIKERSPSQPAAGFLRIITPDLLGRSSPDLAVLTDQAELDALAEGCDLIILDNLSALLRSGAAENDAESWVAVSDWALAHRAAGRSILFVHHSGKNGAQRGTSRREDLLDVVVALRKPQEYDPRDGARFECHFEKGRHMTGDQMEPFEAKLDDQAPGGWLISTCDDNIDQQIIERLALRLSLTDIGRELNLHKSTVSRRVQALRAAGVLPPEGETVRNTPRNSRQKGLGIDQ